MRILRPRRSIVDGLSEPVRAFMARRLAELAGLLMVVVAVLGVVALATWSAQDPSWNHATSGPVRNALGPIGAIVADLAMQLLGVASLVVVLPIAAVGLALLKDRSAKNLLLRAALALGGVLAAACVASILPRTDRWPLPTGLGGAVGDGISRLLSFIVGEGAGLAIAALVLAILAAASILAACGIRRMPAEAESDDEAAPRPAARQADHDPEPGLAIVAIGATIHGLLTAKATVGRWLRRVLQPAGEPDLALAAAAAPAPRKVAAEPAPMAMPAPGRPKARTEPRFEAMAAAPPVPQPSPLSEPDDDDEPEADEPTQTEPPPARPAAARQAAAAEPPVPSTRVTMPQASIKPGRRNAREAQPSLLDVEAAYKFPPLAMLAEPKKSAVQTVSADSLEQNARLLEGVLEDFGVRGEIINVRPGPVVTLYELEPAPGTKSSRVISLADDIARSMSAVSARVAVIQGKNAIGIELPNQRRETVYLRELLASQDYETTKLKLPLCLGKTIGGEPVIAELSRMPHLLIAGTTGSGKSVAVNTMILSLLYRLRPEECRLIMVDPKMLELSVYEGIPHLLTPVVTDPKKAVVALKWAVREMEDRYRKMSKLGVRNIDGYNTRIREAAEAGEPVLRGAAEGEEDLAQAFKPLPYIVVIVDEMADLMMVAGKEIEGAIQRLAQMARAAGIHVVLATQRPSVDVITGTIKANFPTRISFQVTSKIDSRTILGEQGAEQLLGQGDMLYMAGGGRITRVHGPFVSDAEVEKVVAHLKTQGRPDYLEDVLAEEEEAGDDGDTPVFDQGEFGSGTGDLYDQAIAIVLRDKKASTSYIQRRLQIGYNRAASIMERMEKEGIVGPANHAGKREILLEGGGRTDDAA